jgi:hypothetical protein
MSPYESDQQGEHNPTLLDRAIPRTHPELLHIAQDAVQAANFLQWLQEASKQVSEALAQKIHTDNLSDQATALNAHISTLEETAIEQNAVISELQAQLKEKSVNVSTPVTSQNWKSEKLPDPPIYNGEPELLRPFLASLQTKLVGNADRYPTEQSKLSYSFTRLGGRASAQIIPHIKDGLVGLKGLSEFVDILQQAFGDPDRKATALANLRKLRQTNRPFPEYYANFQEYMAEINNGDYGESVKKNTLLGGVNNELHDLMINHDEPESLSDLVKLLMKLDSRLRARRNATTYNRSIPTRPNFQHPFGSGPRQQNQSLQGLGPVKIPARPQYPAAQVNVHVPHDPDTMDLSAMIQGQANSLRNPLRGPRGPISDTEKQRRFNENLCLRCGRSGHMRRDCPLGQRDRLQGYAAELRTEPSAQDDTAEPAGNEWSSSQVATEDVKKNST